LEQVFVGPPLSVVEGIVHFAVRENVSTFWVVQPKQRAESNAVSVNVKILQHGGDAEYPDVTFASLTIPNPIFFDAVPRDFVGRQLVGLFNRTNHLTKVIILLHKSDGVHDFPDAVSGQREGEFVVQSEWSCTVGDHGSLYQQSFSYDVKQVLSILDGVERKVERVVELLAQVNLLPNATLVHHISLPEVGIWDDALGQVGFLHVRSVQYIGRLSYTLLHESKQSERQGQACAQELFHGM
jgi:hypothetical protein